MDCFVKVCNFSNSKILFFFCSLSFLCLLGVCRLDVYIYDYLVKKKLHNTAKSFMTEGKVSPDPVGKN